MTIKKLAGEVDNVLVASVVDANFGTGEFSIRESSLFHFNLLVRSPEIEVLWSRSVVQQERDRHRGGSQQKSLGTGGCEERHARKDGHKPDRRRQRHPRDSEEGEDAGQTASKIPGISVERARSEFNLAADGLSEGNEDGSDQPEQNGGKDSGEQKGCPVARKTG